MTEVSDCLGAKQLMGSDRRVQFSCTVEIHGAQTDPWHPHNTRGGFTELLSTLDKRWKALENTSSTGKIW